MLFAKIFIYRHKYFHKNITKQVVSLKKPLAKHKSEANSTHSMMPNLLRFQHR